MSLTPQAVVSAPLSECRWRYVANLAALYRHDAELAERLEALPFAEVPPLEPTRDGHFTVKLPADDGKSIYAHSRYQPVAEADRLIQARPAPSPAEARQAPSAAAGEMPSPQTASEPPASQPAGQAAPPHTEHSAFVVYGPGLGYVLAQIEQRADRPLIIVCEDDLRLLKAALCLHDFAEAIGAGRMVFLWSLDKAALTEKLMRANADVLLGLRHITPPHAKRYHAAFHRQMSGLLLDFAATSRTQIVTLLRTARVTMQNIALNAPDYVAQAGVETLAGRAAGYPAIVVAAGPSLIRNLAQLGPLRDRAVIISVQTVFKLLVSLGIEPHFVTSLDFHEISAEFFRGVENVGDCALVAEPKATWRVLDAWPGRRFVLHHRAYETLLGAAGAAGGPPQHGELKPGSTVAHLAFYLAQHLGCDPIIFVGQDLAFSDGMFYLPGSPIESIWRPELSRFQTIEMKQWERVVRNRPILRKARDVRGQAVYTDDLLFTYTEQFEADFAAWRGRVIQASEGGLTLKGAEAMSLAEAAERYCTRPLPAGLLGDGPEAAPGAWAGMAESVIGALQARLAELAAVQQIAREMSALLARLEGLLDRPSEFNRALVRVDELRTLIRKYDAIYRLVVEVSSTAELRRHSADRQIGTVRRETRETARRRLKRDREFVQEFIAGCAFLADVLPEAIARVRARLGAESGS